MICKGTLCALLLVLPVGAVNCTPPLRAAIPEEVLRVVSPDSVVDAVVTRGSEGATTSEVFRIFLVPSGGRIPAEPGGELFRADKVAALCVEWTHPQLLRLRYDKARIFHFSNFWNSEDVRRFEYTVELRLEAVNPLSSLADSETGGTPLACEHELNG